MTRRQSAGILMTAVGVALIAVATLTPVQNDAPHQGPWWCVHCGSLAVADAIANVVLFLPAGVGVGLLFRRISPAVAGLALVSVAIEAIQAWLIPGRDSSLRDGITNTIGGALGVGLVTQWRFWIVPRPAVAYRLAFVAAGAWAATLGATAALLRPSTPPGLYWGQRGSDSGFAQEVLHVAVNGYAIPLGPLPQSHPVLGALNSDRVVVEVRLGPGAEQIVGAVARMSNRHTEAFRFTHRGSDLFFSLRMRSATARLRTPIVRLRGGLSRGSLAAGERMGLADGTLRIRASLRDGVLRLERRGQPPRAVSLALTQTTGWVFFMPPGVATRAPTWVLNGLWIVALLFPVGYWTTAAAHVGCELQSLGHGAHGTRRVWLVIAGIVVGAFVLIPLAGQTPWPSWWDWCCALIGASSGAWASHGLRAVSR